MTLQLATSDGSQQEIMPAASTTIHTSSVHITKPTNHVRHTSSSSTTLLLSSGASSSSLGVSTSSWSSSQFHSPSSPDTDVYVSESDEHLNASGDYVLAMHDYEADKQNTTCLSFKAGQVIRVYNRDTSGWWDGELEGRRGWFPSNYVGEDITAAADEVSPTKQVKQRRHHRIASSASAISSVSWATSSKSSSSSHDPYEEGMDEDMFEDSSGSYCPPAMAPLLHALSLLQGAVRADRITHFQPSTACIISCVRTILSAAECLPRDAPVLKQFPIMAKARKGLLSDLAGLVSQARKASAETNDEDERDAEIEGMLKLAGRVFTNVRRFLVLAEDCGIELLPSKASVPSQVSIGIERTYSQDPRTNRQPQDEHDTDRTPARPPEGARGGLFPPGAATEPIIRARSAGELRSAQDAAMASAAAEVLQSPRSRSNLGHRAQPSVASVASTTSTISSSTDSTTSTAETPPTPPFPAGPSSTAEILDVLRHTHNQYLSTIAAFVGQSHSHSRTSHASGTAHLYDLARDIVEMVCKLLTVVEAVGRHPDLSTTKLASLRAAKDGLYTVTRAFAESVRMLTAATPSMPEEDERVILQRAATDALKAGADCVSAIKMALTRGVRQPLLVVHLPEAGATPAMFAPADTATVPILRTPSAGGAHHSALHSLYAAQGVEDDQDMTIQAQTPGATPMPPRLLGVTLSPLSPTPVTPLARKTFFSPVDEVDQALPTIAPEAQPLPDSRPSSALSVSRSDDGSSHEDGARTRDGPLPLEEKLIRGDLPPLPADGLGLGIKTDPRMWMHSRDYADDDVAYHPKDGHLVAATLPALIEKLTPHDTLVDAHFANVFLLTFRLFCTPAELLDAIIHRYNLVPPVGLGTEDVYEWQQRKGIPVRLRVTGLIKNWLDGHWRATDVVVLPAMAAFARDALSGFFPAPAQRILALIAARRESRGPPSPRAPALPWPAAEMPRPVMTKGVLGALRTRAYATLSPADFDPLELARQFTLVEAQRFIAIGADEVLRMGHEGGRSPLSVRAVTSLSTAVTGWVSESVLNEPDAKKRMLLLKFFIKLADKCSSLNNFATARSILAALDSSTISRLHQTWLGVPQKQKQLLEELRKLADHSRNYLEYRTRLRNTQPPAVPFLGLYLTDLTFSREGNPSHRASPLNPEKRLINYDRFAKLARIVQDIKRFNIPYNLKPIPEVQEYLHVCFELSQGKTDLQDLYRRSLLVEPKRAADTGTTDVRQIFSWTSRTVSAAGTA